MAAKKSEQRLRWERYLAHARVHERAKQHRLKYIYTKDSTRLPLYGSFVRVWPCNAESINHAKLRLEQLYFKTKVKLKSLGIELSPPEWKVKEADIQCGELYGTVAWKACADMSVSNEDQRKIALRKKRMRRVRI